MLFILLEYGDTETNLPLRFPACETRCRFYHHYLTYALSTSAIITEEDVNNEKFLADFDV